MKSLGYTEDVAKVTKKSVTGVYNIDNIAFVVPYMYIERDGSGEVIR